MKGSTSNSIRYSWFLYWSAGNLLYRCPGFPFCQESWYYSSNNKSKCLQRQITSNIEDERCLWQPKAAVRNCSTLQPFHVIIQTTQRLKALFPTGSGEKSQVSWTWQWAGDNRMFPSYRCVVQEWWAWDLWNVDMLCEAHVDSQLWKGGRKEVC